MVVIDTEKTNLSHVSSFPAFKNILRPFPWRLLPQLTGSVWNLNWWVHLPLFVFKTFFFPFLHFTEALTRQEWLRWRSVFQTVIWKSSYQKKRRWRALTNSSRRVRDSCCASTTQAQTRTRFPRQFISPKRKMKRIWPCYARGPGRGSALGKLRHASNKSCTSAMASIHLYFARKQVGDTPKRGKLEMRSSCRNSLDLHWSAAGLQVSPTSDTSQSQSVAILMNRPHCVLQILSPVLVVSFQDLFSDKFSFDTKRMQALWGEPWTARSVFLDGNEVVLFRGDVTYLWRRDHAKHCMSTQWRQGPVERRRNDGSAHWPGF